VGTVGFDAGKRVKGRKRHVAVDSLGLPLALVVTGAQVQDNEPAAVAQLFVRLRRMLQRAEERSGRWPKLHEVTGDGMYRGTAAMWAKQMGFSLRTVGRSGAGRGFERLPKRWVVERSFAWWFHFRRLLFDLEYKVENSEGMLWLAGINLMLDRIWPRPTS
jgi:putative transposase